MLKDCFSHFNAAYIQTLFITLANPKSKWMKILKLLLKTINHKTSQNVYIYSSYGKVK